MNHRVTVEKGEFIESVIVSEVKLTSDRIVMRQANPSSFPQWAKKDMTFVSDGQSAYMSLDADTKVVKVVPVDKKIEVDPVY